MALAKKMRRCEALKKRRRDICSSQLVLRMIPCFLHFDFRCGRDAERRRGAGTFDTAE
jgi:hypothetical protein